MSTTSDMQTIPLRELDYKEGWVPKNWCFQIVVLGKTLESPLDSKESQPILEEINPEYSLEGLMLKLKLQYSSHLMWRADSLEKTLMLGKVEGRGGDGWVASLTQCTWVCANSRRQWRTGKLGMLWSMVSQRVGHNLVTEKQRQPRPSEPYCSLPLSDHNSYLSPPYLLFSSNLFLKYTSCTLISGPLTSPLPLPGMLFAQVSAVFPHFLQASAQMTSFHEVFPGYYIIQQHPLSALYSL